MLYFSAISTWDDFVCWISNNVCLLGWWIGSSSYLSITLLIEIFSTWVTIPSTTSLTTSLRISSEKSSERFFGSSDWDFLFPCVNKWVLSPCWLFSFFPQYSQTNFDLSSMGSSGIIIFVNFPLCLIDFVMPKYPRDTWHFYATNQKKSLHIHCNKRHTFNNVRKHIFFTGDSPIFDTSVTSTCYIWLN
jgi:hypothetical protein